MSYNSYVFPLNASEADYFGLTKREYFAAMAMQGMAQRIDVEGQEMDCAIAAVSYADALLAELERTK